MIEYPEEICSSGYFVPILSVQRPFTSRHQYIISMMVTTYIYFQNLNQTNYVPVPHIGHLYSSVLADATCRWHALKQGINLVKLATGTDEHGIKIQKAALKANCDLDSYCDNYSAKFRSMADTFAVAYTDFIRTTDVVHIKAVQKFWVGIYMFPFCSWIYCIRLLH